MQALGVQQFQGDLADFEALQKAVNQQDVILHTAAKAGFWGSDQSYFNTNVLGTENLIKASQEAGVNKLIYTSSASVVFGGSGIENGSVDLPYPDHPLNAYTKTKALAEKLVLDANAANLKTLSLRPHIVLGPGDQHILPRLLERAKSGQLRQIGSGKNQVDIVYIDNLVDAHLLAIDAIDNNPQCLGKSYFITNGEPVVLWEFINQLLAGLALPPLKKKISYRMGLLLAAALTRFHWWFLPNREPLLTPFLIKELSQSHWFDPKSAMEALGYSPRISSAQTLEKLIAHYRLS